MDKPARLADVPDVKSHKEVGAFRGSPSPQRCSILAISQLRGTATDELDT
jgi:hypothetical protein